MATLYELTDAARQLYDLLQADEIDEQTVADTLESMGAEDKLKSYCQLVSQFNADIEMFRAEAVRIAARKKTAENGVLRLKDALTNYLQQSGQKKAKAGTFTISLRKSVSVEITDESKLESCFLIPSPPKVDKIAIREALNSGATVEGAQLVEKEGVQIR